MPMLAGVFDKEIVLDGVLGQLFELGVFEEDVFLLEPDRSTSGASPTLTAQAYAAPLPNISRVEGEIENLRITDEERERLARTANEKNATVAFVYVEPELVKPALNAMQYALEVHDLSLDD